MVYGMGQDNFHNKLPNSFNNTLRSNRNNQFFKFKDEKRLAISSNIFLILNSGSRLVNKKGPNLETGKLFKFSQSRGKF